MVENALRATLIAAFIKYIIYIKFNDSSSIFGDPPANCSWTGSLSGISSSLKPSDSHAIDLDADIVRGSHGASTSHESVLAARPVRTVSASDRAEFRKSLRPDPKLSMYSLY